jgi:hypothetical protein
LFFGECGTAVTLDVLCIPRCAEHASHPDRNKGNRDSVEGLEGVKKLVVRFPLKFPIAGCWCSAKERGCSRLGSAKKRRWLVKEKGCFAEQNLPFLGLAEDRKVPVVTCGGGDAIHLPVAVTRRAWLPLGGLGDFHFPAASPSALPLPVTVTVTACEVLSCSF